jgi:hypothetical protein
MSVTSTKPRQLGLVRVQHRASNDDNGNRIEAIDKSEVGILERSACVEIHGISAMHRVLATRRC